MLSSHKITFMLTSVCLGRKLRLDLSQMTLSHSTSERSDANIESEFADAVDLLSQKSAW
jgi:hypothetical protein